MTTTDVQPLLDRVADKLRTHGWCQGSLSDAGGRRCLLGAIWSVDDDTCKAEDELRSRAGLGDFDSLAGWNDAPGRTVEEVLALLAPR